VVAFHVLTCAQQFGRCARSCSRPVSAVVHHHQVVQALPAVGVGRCLRWKRAACLHVKLYGERLRAQMHIAATDPGSAQRRSSSRKALAACLSQVLSMSSGVLYACRMRRLSYVHVYNTQTAFSLVLDLKRKLVVAAASGGFGNVCACAATSTATHERSALYTENLTQSKWEWSRQYD
jgi:hypothetical protein